MCISVINRQDMKPWPSDVAHRPCDQDCWYVDAVG